MNFWVITILTVLIVLTILTISVLSMKIKLEFRKLKINIPKYNDKITNKESKAYLKIYILKIIKIAEIDLKKIDFKDEKIRNKFQKQLEKNKFNLDTIKLLRGIDYIVEKMNLNINIGTEDSAITAISVGIIYSVISNYLNKKVKDIREIKYNINPIYKGENILDIELDSIITLKFENIINIIRLLRKGSEEKNVKSSNREYYAHSNE